MSEKVLRTSTPKANREHVCDVCGKPICKGERYLNITVKKDGRLISRKTHFGCSEKKEKAKVMAIPGVPVTEEQFKEQVHDDTLTMLETFTFEENMAIAFVPLIMTEVAWYYAFKVLKYTADNRISDTLKLSRQVKALREQYLTECRKDLDTAHIKKMENGAVEFVKKWQMDFTLMWYSINNQLKRESPDLIHLDMRTDACITLTILDVLYQHNRKMDELMSKKLGGEVPTYINPINDKLRTCMEAYVAPAKFEITEHVKTSMKILHNRFAKIEFDVK